MKFLLTISALLTINFVLAQGTTGNSGTGENIDVTYHRFEWNINPDNSIRIGGSVTTYFIPKEDDVQRITFDLIKDSYDNSELKVFYRGTQVQASFPSTGDPDILQIDFPDPLTKDVLDSVTIFYEGVPPAGGAQIGGCFQKEINGHSLFYTLSESYEDREWWPCKADMQDKIDSIDFIIKTPEDYTPAANGVLVSEEISGGIKTSVFKHRYPIASYLVGIAVTKYDIYNRGTVTIGGKEVPVVYYISQGRVPTASQFLVMDGCKEELQIFSNLFGDYPYKDEKYGMYEFGFNGGMEHQTFSGMSWGAFLSPSIVAHELMHQWFGDKVTMSTWNHLWLSEGFASYGQVLAGEFGETVNINPVAQRASFKSAANNSTQRNYGCYIPDDFIVNSAVLWGSQYSNTVYNRGGMVVSMLRTLMGDDKFFAASRNYLNDPELAFKSAVTDDLRGHIEDALDGFNMSGFFESFVIGNGYPIYGKNGDGNPVKWQAVDTDKIRFRIDPPAKSIGSNVETYFSVIPLRVNGLNGEEELVILFDGGEDGVSVGGNGITVGNSPTVDIFLGFTPVSVDFDPYSMSLAEGVAVEAEVAAVHIQSFKVNRERDVNTAILVLAEGDEPVSVILERSDDGSTFSTAGIMAKQDGRYVYHDKSHGQTTYYRVKITEITGDITFTEVVRVAGDPISSFSIITNPVTDRITLKVPVELNGVRADFTILDPSGRSIYKTSRVMAGGTEMLNIGYLPNGTYLLDIRAGKDREVLKFVVGK